MALDGWRAHLPGLLADSKGNRVCIKAAILVCQGEHIWLVASEGYNISLEEQKAIVASLADPAKAQASGIRAGGQKFFTLSAEKDKRIYGKKQADGIIIVKTAQTVVVAEYAAPVQAQEATDHVEKYAQTYLS